MSGTAGEDDLRADLIALRDGAAVAVPRVRSVIGISGPDHVDWLDRISSMPVKDLAPGRVIGATLMDGKGKLRADLRVLHLPEARGAAAHLLLDVPATSHAALLRVLDMYILREKVVLADHGKDLAWLSVLGPRAAALLTGLGLPLPGEGEVLAAEPAAALGGAAATTASPATAGLPAVVASRVCGAPGFDVLLDGGAAEALAARFVERGARRVEPAALNVERIANGVPWFASELADGVIPLEAGLDADVSITKGCYPGQEVVARILNLGQVARRLVRLGAPGRHALAPGDLLHGTGARAGQEAGRLTSAAFDPLGERSVALGFVRRGSWEAGSVLRAGDVELTVQPLH